MSVGIGMASALVPSPSALPYSVWLYMKLQHYLVHACVGLGCMGFPNLVR